MSNYVSSGTITTDTTTDSVSCRGWASLTAHLDSGAGTWTWQFMGADGVWRSIHGNTSDFTTEAQFTATHMLNVFFGTGVKVRGNATAGTNPVWDWQIMSNPSNRGGGF